jgi:hypothetical protein
VEAFALNTRKFFNISLMDQANAKDAKAFYLLCRKKIEDKGIFILHDSFPETDGSGFCLAHATHPLILVNTKRQSRDRRLFTPSRKKLWFPWPAGVLLQSGFHGLLINVPSPFGRLGPMWLFRLEGMFCAMCGVTLSPRMSATNAAAS